MASAFKIGVWTFDGVQGLWRLPTQQYRLRMRGKVDGHGVVFGAERVGALTFVTQNDTTLQADATLLRDLYLSSPTTVLDVTDHLGLRHRDVTILSADSQVTARIGGYTVTTTWQLLPSPTDA